MQNVAQALERMDGGNMAVPDNSAALKESNVLEFFHMLSYCNCQC